MAYISRVDLTTYLGFSTSETADNTLLDTLIAAAQSAVDSYCKRSFEGTTQTRYYGWEAIDRAGRLRLDDDLLTTTTGSATVITNGDTGATVITSTQYRLEPWNTTSKRLVKLLSASGVGWQFGTDGRVSVAGTWGFTTAAPNDVVQATKRLAAYFYRQKDSQVFDVTAMPGMGEMIIPKGMPADVVKLLKPYRRVVMV